MSENYIIKKETLTATADAIRSHIGSTPTFKSEVAGEDNMLATEVNVYYVEYIDENYGGYGLEEGADGTDAFIAYDYLPDNNGIITPVLYKTDIDTEYQDPDHYDPFFYAGPAQIDGVGYDKWRKIELEGDITWESSTEKYVYTNIIVDSVKISPLEFPSKIDEVYEKGIADCPYNISGEKCELTITVTNNAAYQRTLVLIYPYITEEQKIDAKRDTYSYVIPAGETRTFTLLSLNKGVIFLNGGGSTISRNSASNIGGLVGQNSTSIGFVLNSNTTASLNINLS